VQYCFFLMLWVSYFLIHAEHKRMQRLGYVTFYHSSNYLNRLGFFSACVSTTTIVVIFVFLPQDFSLGNMSAADILSFLVTMTCAFLVMVYGRYVYECVQHNSQQELPDAHRFNELPEALSTPLMPPAGAYAHKKESKEDLMTKQAQMIVHLEDKIKRLGRELARVKDQQEVGSLVRPGSSLDNNNNNNPLPHSVGSYGRHNDLDHLMADKEQECRALRVERDKARLELKKMHEDFEEYRRMNDIVRSDQSDTLTQIDSYKETVAKQAEEISRLLLLNEVQKESLAACQRTIEQYEKQHHQ